MALDLFHSRRGKFKLCKYWKRDENNPSEEWDARKDYDIFYAQPVNFSKQNNQVNNQFMFTQDSTTIFTNDKINIESMDVVEYLGKKWEVINVQVTPHLKESQYGELDGTTYITLRTY